MFGSEILRSNLDKLEAQYHENASSPDIARMVSKIAVIELAGWIEECFDTIARSSIKSQVNSNRARSLVEREIKRISGLDYENHSVRLLSAAFGAGKLAKIENELASDSRLQLFTSQLDNVRKARNSLSHTYTKATQIIDAPDVTINRFNIIVAIFQDISDLANSID